MTLSNSMSITPSPPGQAKGAKFEHGSVLGGKTRGARISSQWKSTPFSPRARGQLQPKYRRGRNRGLKAFGRIKVLTPLTSHRLVCWRLRGAPRAPRLGVSGVGLPRHNRGLNEARKNATGRNRWRYVVSRRLGSDGFEHGYRGAILLVDSYRRGLVRLTWFRASRTRPFGLTVFYDERRRHAFQWYPQNPSYYLTSESRRALRSHRFFADWRPGTRRLRRRGNLEHGW
jgi:hypothetical protein